MAREYLVPAWTGAAEDHDLWSGKSPDDRKRKSHMLSPNRANTDAYSDESIAQLKGQGKATKVPLRQRILPQATRVDKLNDQLRELVAKYKQGEYSIEEYSLYLKVLSAKRAQAERLLAKAISVKAPFEQDDNEESFTPSSSKSAHEQHANAANRGENSGNIADKGACKSAKADAIIFITGAVVILTVLKFFI